MSQQNAPITILAGAALEPNRRVKKSGASWIYAGLAENHDAITIERIASGGYGAALPRSYPGTVEIEAAGAITDGAVFYGAASGKISATAAGGSIGKNVGGTGTGVGNYECLMSGDAEVFESLYTATAGDDTNNYADIDTGFGAAPTGAVLVQIRSTTGVHRSPQGIVTLNASGVIRVADTGLAVNEIIMIRARK